MTRTYDIQIGDLVTAYSGEATIFRVLEINPQAGGTCEPIVTLKPAYSWDGKPIKQGKRRQWEIPLCYRLTAGRLAHRRKILTEELARLVLVEGDMRP
jgi:hypothetical protein